MRISDWSSDVCSSDLCASWRHRSPSAAANASAPGSSACESGALPALPVAKASTVSLVEVSLSTVMHEKVVRLAALSSASIEVEGDEIGRASCRERVCQYVVISVGDVSL